MLGFGKMLLLSVGRALKLLEFLVVNLWSSAVDGRQFAEFQAIEKKYEILKIWAV